VGRTLRHAALFALLAASLARPAAATPSLVLALQEAEVSLVAGYTRVSVEVEPGAMASVIVFGDKDALEHFAVDGVVAHDPLEEDGRLPRVASFLVPEGITSIELSLEVSSPALVTRVLAPVSRELPKGESEPLLIGMPSPARRDDGYLLERPNRYQFARPDVAMALMDAFRDTRLRYRRDPVTVADISQWNGKRPAVDLGAPRHVSHEGGRDVDLGLPATDGPSSVRDHCDRDTSKDFTKAVCKKGSVRGLDAGRLAYLLGRLVKKGNVDKIFLDAELIDPMAKAALALRTQGVLKPDVADKLQPEGGVVRHLAWHTDHVHVRFFGAKGTSPFER
jgi:hypothetical protein